MDEYKIHYQCSSVPPKWIKIEKYGVCLRSYELKMLNQNEMSEIRFHVQRMLINGVWHLPSGLSKTLL